MAVHWILVTYVCWMVLITFQDIPTQPEVRRKDRHPHSSFPAYRSLEANVDVMLSPELTPKQI